MEKLMLIRASAQLARSTTMTDRDLLGIATTAKIGSHPLHPMLVPFPIVLLVATFACDLAYWQTARPFWAEAAFWSLGAAIVMAALAAVAGFTDFLGNAAVWISETPGIT